MTKKKVLITRDTLIQGDQLGVKDEVVEVSSDTARNLKQAGAAIDAAEDAKVGKPKKETTK
ncbi:hypothetical protein CRN37_09505 [Vibrio vulnificus]|uniref:hypothetical protein n=1 Tax=Vibrio vulnificus TaxID=672 RepID=UPI000CD325A7|nr:hypothetical protein [Vibrio vulnificus]POC58492.1 hypothetical protein CRN37_09505 [Vibrio vulnificus]POC73062.1 hypothetical protein CRN34_09345 [Vibrio vulnificus]